MLKRDPVERFRAQKMRKFIRQATGPGANVLDYNVKPARIFGVCISLSADSNLTPDLKYQNLDVRFVRLADLMSLSAERQLCGRR